MRVVLLTQYYPPETGAPQARLADLARRLSAHGHEIEVVTAMPNYPTGSIFPGWRGLLLGAERDGGQVVLRSWLYTSPRPSTPRQLATYGSFATTAALTAPLRLRRADVLLWESPPLFLAPTAALLRRRLGARLVMNVSDLWPQSAVDLGVLRSRRLLSLLEGWERWAYASADLVTYQTEGIGAGIERRAPAARRALFPNGVDLDRFRRRPARPELRAQLGLPESGPVVGYAGNFGRAQSLEQVVDAAALLEAGGSPATFLLVGDGPRRQHVEERARSLGLAHVRFSRPWPASQMPELLSLFDAAVVPLADAPVFAGARPSKMFELLAVGVPFVYCGRGEGAALAQASGAALVVDPEDPPALAGAIARLLALGKEERQAWSGRGRQFVALHFDRARIAHDLERQLVELVAGGRHGNRARHRSAHAASRSTTAPAAPPAP